MRGLLNHINILRKFSIYLSIYLSMSDLSMYVYIYLNNNERSISVIECIYFGIVKTQFHQVPFLCQRYLSTYLMTGSSLSSQASLVAIAVGKSSRGHQLYLQS